VEVPVLANTFFYTFSTLSQTLAGVIALLGAFVLYRLQTWTHEMDKASAILVHRYEAAVPGFDAAAREAIQRLHDEQRYREVHEFLALWYFPG
jgi:hypothetical protein